jgi:signal transduction histidine kinase
VNRKYHYNILAVDDEIYNLEAIQRTFRKLYQVFITPSPQEAIRIFQQEPIHLVIADQRMPEMLGTELLARLKEINPNPIRIVLSAYTDIDYLIQAINRGEVYRYITKPWDPHELQVTVQKALEHYQANMDRLQLIEDLRSKNLELDAALRELKETQEKLLQAERLSILGRMASMIIHDLKQPLDFIRSAAETMARVDLDQADRIEIATMIKQETHRFTEMIQEILDYSKGEYKPHLDTLTVNEFWAALESRIRGYLQNYEINWQIRPVESEARVQVDTLRMQRVIFNIVKNALEAVRALPAEKNPTIRIETHIENNQLMIAISDNGPGIPTAALPHVFEPFFSHNKKNGIGLGLAIAKSIVEAHQGTITCQSSPDQGTQFTISLPLLQT